MQLSGKQATFYLWDAPSRAMSMARSNSGNIRSRGILTELPFSVIGPASSMRERSAG
jgi:hypothetical protein